MSAELLQAYRLLWARVPVHVKSPLERALISFAPTPIGNAFVEEIRSQDGHPAILRETRLADLLRECDSLLAQHHNGELCNFDGECPVCSKNGSELYPDNIFGRIKAALNETKAAGAVP